MILVTALDVYHAVLHELRKEHTSSMEPKEFNYYVNIAQIELIKTRYWAFDQHQKHIDDLEQLIVRTTGNGGMPSPVSNTGGSFPGQECFELPYINSARVADPHMPNTTEGKMFLLNVQGNLDKELCGTTCVNMHYFKHDRISNNDYYDMVDDGRIFYQEYNGKIWRHVACGNSTCVVNSVILSYIRYPNQIELDVNTGDSLSNPELNSRFNIEIVKWTVRNFLETIESNRQQTFPIRDQGVFNQLTPDTRR